MPFGEIDNDLHELDWAWVTGIVKHPNSKDLNDASKCEEEVMRYTEPGEVYDVGGALDCQLLSVISFNPHNLYPT